MFQIKSIARIGVAAASLFRSFCCNTPSHKIIKLEDILKAAVNIKDKVIMTPCNRSLLSELYEMELYLKKDLYQATGR